MDIYSFFYYIVLLYLVGVVWLVGKCVMGCLT